MNRISRCWGMVRWNRVAKWGGWGKALSGSSLPSPDLYNWSSRRVQCYKNDTICMKMIRRGSAIDAYRYDSAVMVCGKLRAKNRRKSGENCGVTKIEVHDVSSSNHMWASSTSLPAAYVSYSTETIRSPHVRADHKVMEYCSHLVSEISSVHLWILPKSSRITVHLLTQ
jgi:hypothetical protein